MKLFNHVSIKVKDLQVSRTFYDRVMATLGHKVVLEINRTDKIVVGYGTDTSDMFELFQVDEKSSVSQNVHIAFNAASKDAVDAFYYAALEAGGKCNGKPGIRNYGGGFYAAFVIDLDGHNIEAIF